MMMTTIMMMMMMMISTAMSIDVDDDEHDVFQISPKDEICLVFVSWFNLCDLMRLLVIS